MTVNDLRPNFDELRWQETEDSVIGAGDIVKLTRRLLEKHDTEVSRLRALDPWLVGRNPIPRIDNSTKEMRRLQELAGTPWMKLIVDTTAQTMFVDSFHSQHLERGDTSVWRMWVANGMPAHQNAIHRAAIGYGYAFGLAATGVNPHDGAPMARLRGLSPKRCYAEYVDPGADEWPRFALVVMESDHASMVVHVYDETFKHVVSSEREDWHVVSSTPHGASHVPIVDYAGQRDLEGRCMGDVEPFIGLAARLDKTKFDGLLTQHYNSWKKIVVSGLKRPKGITEELARLKEFELQQKDLIIFEDAATSANALPETRLEGFIAAYEAEVDNLAVNSQLNHLLTGKLSNLSEDTLTAANKPWLAKIFERQTSFGASHSRLIRLACHLEGRDDVAADVESYVGWQDVEMRSLSQAADALGKMATMLGVPYRALWRMIPDITETQAAEWERMLASDDPIDRMVASQLGLVGSPDDVDNDLADEE